jgi:hypothetical protein
MKYAALLALLRADPETFLPSHYLKTRVSSNAVFGPADYYFGGAADFSKKKPMPLRWGAGRWTKGSKVLNFVPHSMLFQLAPGDKKVQPDKLAATPVWLVPAELATTVANYGAMAGDAVQGGSDIMITPLLNGCSFCCADSPGGMLVKHIQPTGATNHVVLATTLSNTGAFAGQTANSFRFFGSGGFGYDAGTEDATIVGVRRNGVWAGYAQVHSRTVNNILRVTRFFQQ